MSTDRNFASLRCRITRPFSRSQIMYGERYREEGKIRVSKALRLKGGGGRQSGHIFKHKTN